MKSTISTIFSLFLAATAVTSPAQIAWFSPGGGDESPSYLGVYLQDVTPELAEELGLKRQQQGVICADIIPDSPAEDAGLEANDLITRWDGERVRSAGQFKRLVGETPVGRTVKVAFLRDGEATQLKATVGQRDLLSGRSGQPFRQFEQRQLPLGPWHPPIDVPDPFSAWSASRRPRLGIEMQPLAGQLARYFGLDGDARGVLIVSVVDDSAAEEAGLRAGDVITHIAGTPVDSPDDVQGEILRADAGLLDITVVRDGNVVQAQAELGSPDGDNDDDADTDDEELKEEISYPRGTL